MKSPGHFSRHNIPNGLDLVRASHIKSLAPTPAARLIGGLLIGAFALWGVVKLSPPSSIITDCDIKANDPNFPPLF